MGSIYFFVPIGRLFLFLCSCCDDGIFLPLRPNNVIVEDVHLNEGLLLQSHQASQQTNFGRVRTSQFPEPGSFEKFRMYIAAFASISSNRNRGSFDFEENHHQSSINVEKILFPVESHVFAGEEFESK